MIIHEDNDLIYTNLRSQIVVEILLVINTTMETHLVKIDIAIHGVLFGLKSIVGWWNGKTSMVGCWPCKVYVFKMS